MTTPGSWLAYKRFNKFSGFFYNHPWYWNPVKNRLQDRPLKELPTWFILNSAMIWLFLYTVYLALRELLSTKSDPDFLPGMALNWIIVIAGLSQAICFSYTLIDKRKEACNAITQFYYLAQDIINDSKRIARPQRFKIDVEGFIINFITVALLLGSTLGFLYPFLRKGEPVYFMLRFLGLSKWPNILLRSGIQGVIFVHGVFVSLNMLSTAAIYIFLVLGVLKELKKPFALTGKWGRVAKKKNLIQEIANRFENTRRMYNTVRVLSTMANDVIKFWAPATFITMMTWTVVLGTIVFTLWDITPLGIYIAAGFLGAGGLFAMVAIVPFCGDIHEYSKSIIQLWKEHKQYLSRQDKKVLESWPYLKLEVGQFFYVKKCTPATFLWHTIYNLITVILSVNVGVY